MQDLSLLDGPFVWRIGASLDCYRVLPRIRRTLTTTMLLTVPGNLTTTMPPTVPRNLAAPMLLTVPRDRLVAMSNRRGDWHDRRRPYDGDAPDC